MIVFLGGCLNFKLLHEPQDCDTYAAEPLNAHPPDAAQSLTPPSDSVKQSSSIAHRLAIRDR